MEEDWEQTDEEQSFKYCGGAESLRYPWYNNQFIFCLPRCFHSIQGQCLVGCRLALRLLVLPRHPHRTCNKSQLSRPSSHTARPYRLFNPTKAPSTPPSLPLGTSASSTGTNASFSHEGYCSLVKIRSTPPPSPKTYWNQLGRQSELPSRHPTKRSHALSHALSQPLRNHRQIHPFRCPA